MSSTASKNISVHSLVETDLLIPPSHPARGAYHDRHERWGGMRWTRQRLARDGIAGRVERLLSDHRHADERRFSRTAKSCGPDAPTLASSLAEFCRPNRAMTKRYPRDDGGKRARSPGRARHKPLKPLRAGMPGDSGVPVATTRVLSTLHTGLRVQRAPGIPHALHGGGR
jgi:hypothetical protein